MTETLGTNASSPEVEVMQAWIESEVIGKGTCPPLIKLAKKYSKNEVLDWTELSKEVAFLSFYNYFPKTDTLTSHVSKAYADYIVAATTDTAPVTSVFILPDFQTIEDYSDFMSDVRSQTVEKLLTVENGEDIIKTAYQKAADAEGLSRPARLFLHRKGNVETAAEQVVNSIFRPGYFYGKNLNGQELAAFADDRGDTSRQMILSRAPYFAFQVVTPFGADHLIGNLNSAKLFERNTRLASAIDPQAYGESMDMLRHNGN